MNPALIRAIANAKYHRTLAANATGDNTDPVLAAYHAVNCLNAIIGALEALVAVSSPPRLSLRQACKIAGVSRITARAKIASGAWLAHNEGSRTYVVSSSLYADLTRSMPKGDSI